MSDVRMRQGAVIDNMDYTDTVFTDAGLLLLGVEASREEALSTVVAAQVSPQHHSTPPLLHNGCQLCHRLLFTARWTQPSNVSVSQSNGVTE